MLFLAEATVRKSVAPRDGGGPRRKPWIGRWLHRLAAARLVRRNLSGGKWIATDPRSSRDTTGESNPTLLHQVTVRVGVTMPLEGDLLFIRGRFPEDEVVDAFRASKEDKEACLAGAISGARYARRVAGHDRAQIEIHRVLSSTIEGVVEDEGSVVAAMYATWAAYGYAWTPLDDRETHGWSLASASRIIEDRPRPDEGGAIGC